MNRHDKRLQQAHERGLDRKQAMAFTSRLLDELEAYLQRRQRRHLHTDFDDLLETLLPGLALALQLLGVEEASLEQIDLQARWEGLSPETQALLKPLAATFGLEYADRVAGALAKEVDRKLSALRAERTDLVIAIMEWGTERDFPRLRGDGFDVPETVDGWSEFCGNATPIESLRAVLATIHLRQQAALGRQRLAQISTE